MDLNRQFTDVVGLSPRTLARILRMRRLLESVDVFGLVDWDDAARWMSGVEGLGAHGPTAVGTELVFTTRGKQRTTHQPDRGDGPWAQHHFAVRSGRGDH